MTETFNGLVELMPAGTQVTKVKKAAARKQAARKATVSPNDNTPQRERAPISDDHKAALERGRNEGRVVRRYLEHLDSHKPKRGRQRSKDGIEKRLTQIEKALSVYTNPLTRLQLIQERMDLQAASEVKTDLVDGEGLEKEFTKVAQGYSARKGISATAWRELGVPNSVLRSAGIT